MSPQDRRGTLRPDRKPWVTMAVLATYLLVLALWIGFTLCTTQHESRPHAALGQCWEVVPDDSHTL